MISKKDMLGALYIHNVRELHREVLIQIIS